MEISVPTPAPSSNADQIAYWNGGAGDAWTIFQKNLDAQVAPLGDRALDRLAPAAGETVLDIGCGCGQTTRELARRVGSHGAVTAVDISKPMLAVAAREAADAGLRNIHFVEADAQIHAFPPGAFDAAFSRFGVMFFADPVAAFANLRAALKPATGRIAFVCWRALAENPWMTVPVQAARGHLPPQPQPDPDAPGPFAFADRDRLERILAQAGYTDIAITPADDQVALGPLDEAVERSLYIGALARLLDEHPQARAPVPATLRDTLRPFATDGGVRLDAAVWIVGARRP
jgi:SAM-dependent methyltransferase